MINFNLIHLGIPAHVTQAHTGEVTEALHEEQWSSPGAA